ncbi:C-type Lectin CRL-like [Latimeria chalumnae]|uniref:C-type Lectin CRL-like n=1 Tax=Latimeria chalumnae TaxID=7897 RepID=UPI00313D8653
MKRAILLLALVALTITTVSCDDTDIKEDEDDGEDLDLDAVCNATVYRPCHVRRLRGWTQIGCKCYRVIRRPLYYKQAEAYCHRCRHCHLVSFHYRRSYRRIGCWLKRYQTTVRKLWIGLNYKVHSKRFVWTDRSRVSYVNVYRKRWRFRHNRRCVVISAHRYGRWRGSRCHIRRPALCEYRPASCAEED